MEHRDETLFLGVSVRALAFESMDPKIDRPPQYLFQSFEDQNRTIGGGKGNLFLVFLPHLEGCQFILSSPAVRLGIIPLALLVLRPSDSD